MMHRHGRVEHEHLNADVKHGHPGGELYWEREHVAVSGPRPEGEYQFVPGEILIHPDDAERDGVRRILDENGLVPFRGADAYDKGEPPNELPPEELRPPPDIPGVRMLTMVPEFRTRGHEIPRIVDDIRNLGRDQPSNQPPPRVAPNHVLYGINHVVIGPGRSPTRASQPFRSFPQTDVGHGVKIVVLDTGIIKHPLLASFDPAEIDPPNDSPVDSELDFEAGHGTFIEGVIRQYAPAADVMHKKVLTSEGRVSDTLLAQRLLSDCGDFDIINLSLGGYTHGNAGPFALPIVLEALRHKNPKQAVVAAAGNDHTDRPFFPAAMKAVIGVAACDDQDNRADYSNFGWWVDARAVGEHVSTFFDLPGQGQPGALNQHNSNQAAEFDWWASWAGTSFAAPVVVGAVAAEISANSGLTAREAAARLLVVNAPTWKPTLGVRIDPTDLTKTAA